MNPGLYIVGTPIGNMEDITLRALETLRQADVIMAEDTRHTRHLLDRHGIQTPLASCHKFNEQARVEEIAGRLAAGQRIALVTDAGMPGISDPGARTAAACRQRGYPVTVIPGPCAVSAAVALCGFPARGFVFEGFLSHKGAARRRRLGEWAASEHPLVLYESPYRLLKLMDEIQETLGPRRVFVARELTKHFEETIEGTPAEIKQSFAQRAVRGELVVIIAPAGKYQAAPPAEPSGDQE